MHVTPTFSTAVLVGLATLLLGVATATTHPTAFAWSGSMIFGLAIARTMTRAKIARARAAGFEMLWQKTERSVTCPRNREVTVFAELRNRSDELLVIDPILPLSAPELSVHVTPATAVLPPHSSLTVQVAIRPLRVGIHGLQGLSVVVRDDSAAFEAQLTFVNPIVIEVMPHMWSIGKAYPYGGRGRYLAPAEKTRPLSGESLELRELRDHQNGDPLRKIAWKASARRGTLLVRDDEREQHNVVHFVLDASVELWSGPMGKSALDEQIDQLASTIRVSLRQGDRVGLTIVASRLLALIEPGVGLAHEKKLFSALIHATTTRDSDRAGIDANDVASIILEHLRPIDPLGTKVLTAANLDATARLAQRHLLRAPLSHPIEPLAPTPTERLLRRYLVAYGLPSSARTTTDRDATDREILETLRQLIAARPDRIVVCSPWPSRKLVEGILRQQRRLRLARISLEWSVTNSMAGLPAPIGIKGQIVEQALMWHADAARTKGSLELRKLGIRIPVYQRFTQSPQASAE